MSTRRLRVLRRAGGAMAGILLATAFPAVAAVDLTGLWSVGGLAVGFVQAGTTLTARVPGGTATATGTIDPDTGVFGIALAALVNEILGPSVCRFDVDGVAAPDGTSFSGTLTLAEPCFGPPTICFLNPCQPPVTEPITGARTSCPDGTLDPGEA